MAYRSLLLVVVGSPPRVARVHRVGHDGRSAGGASSSSARSLDAAARDLAARSSRNGLDAGQGVVEPGEQPLVGLDGLVEQPAAVLRAGVAPAVLGPDPVQGVDVLGVQDHPHLGQGEPEQLLEVRIRVTRAMSVGQVEPLAPAPVAARADQAVLLPVAQGPGGDPGALGQLADAAGRRRWPSVRLGRGHGSASVSAHTSPPAGGRGRPGRRHHLVARRPSGPRRASV